MSIGEKIKQLRIEKGLSQDDLAKMMGYSHKSSINKIELGKNDLPQKKILAFANVFDVSPAFLLDIDDKPRSSIPTNLMPIPKFKKIPLLGSIACGVPILADQNIEEFLDVEQNINADFALSCKGDSMINARIFDGDIVFIKEQSSVENGQVAAVCIDDEETEATLKRVYLTKDSITLVAENGKYPPLAFHKEDMNKVRIIGRAVSFLSKI